MPIKLLAAAHTQDQDTKPWRHEYMHQAHHSNTKLSDNTLSCIASALDGLQREEPARLRLGPSGVYADQCFSYSA